MVVSLVLYVWMYIPGYRWIQRERYWYLVSRGVSPGGLQGITAAAGTPWPLGVLCIYPRTYCTPYPTVPLDAMGVPSYPGYIS